MGLQLYVTSASIVSEAKKVDKTGDSVETKNFLEGAVKHIVAELFRCFIGAFSQSCHFTISDFPDFHFRASQTI